MANAKGHLKLTGDTHLPDAESDLALEGGGASLAALAHERTQPGRANSVRRAGVLREHDDAAEDGGDAGGTDATGEEAMPSANAARPMRAAGPRGAAVAAAPMPWGTIGWMVVGAWLLLKLVRR